jgi:Ca-activated chloride channel family protein
VLGTRVSGTTSLNDALVLVARDLSGRPGKKAIVVFTDGGDNNSSLTSESAIRRTKSEGVAVYTIAQGEALASARLLAQLKTVADGTGGLSFAIKSPSEFRTVFDYISRDLQHGYLLTFRPAPSTERWHPIQVSLRGTRGFTVRAREGYYPE